MSIYTVIGKTNCQWCNKSEELIFNKFGAVNCINFDDEPWLRAFFSGLGLTTVPQIVTPTNVIINGYEELEKYLGSL